MAKQETIFAFDERIPVPAARYAELIRRETELDVIYAVCGVKESWELENIIKTLKGLPKDGSRVAAQPVQQDGEENAE